MKRFLIGTAAAIGAAVAISSAASAAVVITVNPAVTDYNSDVLAVPDSQIVWDFDTIADPRFTFSPGAAVTNGSVSDTYLQPLNDDTNYGAVGPGPDNVQPATFTSTQLMSSFSLLVGSPDFYNRIVFSGPSGVIADLTGDAMYPGIPDNGQNIARRITYDFGSSSVNHIDFYSQFNAFEFDRFAASVPEPATWAMMLLGFFGLGAMLRSQKRNHAMSVA